MRAANAGASEESSNRPHQGLIPSARSLAWRRMSFYGSFFVWIVMAALLVGAVVLAMKVSVLFLIFALGAFTLAFIKYGCLSH